MLVRQPKKSGGCVVDTDDTPASLRQGITAAVEGKRKAMHLGRPGRKRGGAVGSDLSPLSSAAKTCE